MTTVCSTFNICYRVNWKYRNAINFQDVVQVLFAYIGQIRAYLSTSFFLVDLYLFPKDGGYQFTTNGERKSLRGTISFVSGDNLASQEIGGFKIGSCSALKCRVCMGDANDVASKVI